MDDYRYTESGDALAQRIEARTRFYRMECDCNPYFDRIIASEEASDYEEYTPR